MGKQNYKDKLIENGRLSGMSMKKSKNQNSNRFDSRVDARVKLLQKNNTNIGKANLDARQLLLKKQQKERIRNMLFDDKPLINKSLQASIASNINNKSKDPLVIVTGLGNVRKENGKLITKKSSDHYVSNNYDNMMITLKNDRAYKMDNEDDDDDVLRIDKTNNTKFQPIRIRIDNNLAQKPQHAKVQITKPVELNKTSLYSSRLGNANNNNPSNNYSNVESMDYDDDDVDNIAQSKSYANIYSKSGSSNDNRHSTQNLDLVHNNSGYKLLISNLHPKVTEDDVLELFSDIGPIKRARFLDKGLAEVVYVKLEHAQEAIDKYDRNELDGRPMRIELVNGNTQTFDDFNKSKKQLNNNSFIPSSTSYQQPNSRSLQTSSTSIQSSVDTAKDSLSNKFKTFVGNKEPKVNLPESKKNEPIKVNVDSSIIHHVLFNKNKNTTSNPVTFTVKL